MQTKGSRGHDLHVGANAVSRPVVAESPQLARAEASGTGGPVGLLLVAMALFVPVYRELPGNVARGWTAAVLLLIVGVILFGGGRRPTCTLAWLLTGYGAATAVVTATGLGGSVPSNFGVGVQLFVLLGLGPFAMTGLVASRPGLVARVVVAFLVAQTVSAAAAVVQMLGYEVAGTTTVNGRAPGLAGHPNLLGMMSVVALVLCVDALLRGGQRTKLVLAVGAINVLGLLATGSLSALAAAVLGLLVVATVHRVRPGRLILVTAGTVAALALALNLTPLGGLVNTPLDRYLQVTGQTRAQSTLQIREGTYDYALAWITDHPLAGVGLSSNEAATYDSLTVVHNVLLRAWYQGGGFLALGIAAIIVGGAVIAWRCVRDRRDGAAAGVIVGSVAYALTSAFFEQAYYWLPVLLAVAVVSRPRPVSSLGQ